VQEISGDGFDVEASPDGRQIAFVDGGFKEIRLAGSQGESARPFFRAPEGELVASVHWLAGGKRIGYLRGKDGAPEAFVETRALDGADPRTILETTAETVAFASDNRIFYTIKQSVPQQTVTLWTVAIDAASGTAAGSPEKIATWPGAVAAEPLTVSADGRRIALTKTFTQSDVYLVSLDGNSAGLPAPRRLTTDTLIDWPSAWVPDGSAFLFFSNRGGTFRAFRQPATTETASAIVVADGNVRSPQLTADGMWILYIEMSSSPDRARIMRMPAGGGPPVNILDISSRLATAPLQDWAARPGSSGWGARSLPDLRCPARTPDTCFIAEARSNQAKNRSDVVVSSIDPRTGQTREAVTISDGNAGVTFWDVSPDGSTVAHGVWSWGGGDTITLTQPGKSKQVLAIKGYRNVVDIAWAADGRSLLAITATIRGGQLLRVMLDGTARLLQTFESQVLANPRPSPDGRSILLGVAQSNSNAWVIERGSDK